MRATGLHAEAVGDGLAVMTRAAAPSEMLLALAAVMVPSLAKAGLRPGIFSGLALPGCSSQVTISSPFAGLHGDVGGLAVEGAGEIAAVARRRDSMAYSSCGRG
jgi:hypothetical protein